MAPWIFSCSACPPSKETATSPFSESTFTRFTEPSRVRARSSFSALSAPAMSRTTNVTSGMSASLRSGIGIRLQV
jgi:hypothetical protein